MSILSIRNIHKSFGALEVLKGIDTDIARGEMVSIVGASGAGKTTLLQVMGTLLRPDEGSITLADTRSADDAHHFAAGDVGVDAFEHFESAKRFVDVADGEDGHGEEFWEMTKEGEEDGALLFSGRRG